MTGPATGPAELVGQVTGAASPNRTDRWDVHGTDLGHTFEHQGRLWMVLGDTFGAGRRHWRSNAMAMVSFDPGRGSAPLAIEDMVRDRRGRARELLPSRKGAGGEVTVIPTAGVSAGEMVLHAMSVREWGRPGRWSVNESFLAASHDGGRRWRRAGASWPGDSNFAQAWFVPPEEEGGDVAVLGIPAGRFGGAALGRAPSSTLTDASTWRYWDGAAWAGDHRRAALVVPPPVGELSVLRVPALGGWLMLTLDEGRRAVVGRVAEDLRGPWSQPWVVVGAEEHPSLYAPYLLPALHGGDAWFTLSRFDLYNVLLFRLPLRG